MHHFRYKNGELYCEDVPLEKLAEEHGTPLYVYSHATLVRHWRAVDRAFAGQPHLVCYSVKANSNLSLLRTFAELGSGFDIVSAGELFRVIKAGGDPAKVVFSGVGKTEEEIDAALKAGILLFNVETEGELERISRVAKRRRKTARITVRVNPDVDPRTHPYIATGLRDSKFGIPRRRARAVYARAAELPNLQVAGIDCHIGSQLTEVRPFLDALERLRVLIAELRSDGHHIEYLDIGGGLGITYDEEAPPHPSAYGSEIKRALAGLDVRLVLEPGRVIVGNAGVLLTRVIDRKSGDAKKFMIVDAAMNDLIRPSLYDAFHDLWPVSRGRGRKKAKVDVVGPVCESGDFLAKDREVADLAPGDLLAVMSAGAYGFVMSSNYNSRPRAAEVLVDGRRVIVARRREKLSDLIRGEEA
jgi:diaminopimelate decarboxylase